MATIDWRGDAPAVAQVTLLTVTNPGTSSATLTVAINGKTVGVAVVNTQTAIATAALLYAALAATDIAEFLEMTWSYTDGDAFVTGTANSPGLSVTITGSTAGGQTITPSNTTGPTGPNDVDNDANYVGAAKPVNGDVLRITGGGSLLENLDALASVTLAGIEVWASFTGTIGLPEYREQGGYREYRPRYLQSDGNPTVTIGDGPGAGSGRILIDVTGGTGTATVYGTGQRLGTAVPAFVITDTAANTVLNVAGGDVGVAVEAGQTATITTFRLPTPDAAQPTVTFGAGATVVTADVDGGTVNGYGAVTTLGITGGTWTQWGTVPTTVTCDGGPIGARVVLRGTGTVTTATFRGQAGNPAPVCDCSQDPRGRTFTNHTFIGGAVLNDSTKSITFTNAGTWDHASVVASTFGGGQFSLQRT